MYLQKANQINELVILPQCMSPFIVIHDVILGCSLRAWFRVVLRARKTWLASTPPGLLVNKEDSCDWKYMYSTASTNTYIHTYDIAPFLGLPVSFRMRLHTT